MLDNQAKKDFEKWLSNGFEPNENSIEVDCSYEGTIDVYASENFDVLPPSMQYGVIVDWFHSVGIYIDISKVFGGVEYRWWIEDDSLRLEDYQSEAFKTRPQARQKAIVKANEIYNERT